jgi:hypothetical protein
MTDFFPAAASIPGARRVFPDSTPSPAVTCRPRRRVRTCDGTALAKLGREPGGQPTHGGAWKGKPSVLGGVVGALLGGAVGSLSVGCLANRDDYGVPCGGQDDTKFVIGGIVGGLTGGALGALISRKERWDHVDLEQLTPRATRGMVRTSVPSRSRARRVTMWRAFGRRPFRVSYVGQWIFRPLPSNRRGAADRKEEGF